MAAQTENDFRDAKIHEKTLQPPPSARPGSMTNLHTHTRARSAFVLSLAGNGNLTSILTHFIFRFFCWFSSIIYLSAHWPYHKSSHIIIIIQYYIIYHLYTDNYNLHTHKRRIVCHPLQLTQLLHIIIIDVIIIILATAPTRGWIVGEAEVAIDGQRPKT